MARSEGASVSESQFAKRVASNHEMGRYTCARGTQERVVAAPSRGKTDPRCAGYGGRGERTAAGRLPRRRRARSSTSGTPVERVHPDLAVGAVAPGCCDTSPQRTKVAKIAGPRRVQSSLPLCNLRRRRDQPPAILMTARREAFRDESRWNSSGPNRSSRGQKRREAVEYVDEGPKRSRLPNPSLVPIVRIVPTPRVQDDSDKWDNMPEAYR